MRRQSFDRYCWLLPLAAVAWLGAMPAQGSLIISVSSVVVAAGTTGASFDVNIQNTGSTLNIESFGLALSVGTTNITFTGGNTSTADTYLFNGDSFDVINTFSYTTVPPPNGQTLEAADLSNSGNGTNMGTTTLGLGHIFFNVAPGTAAGPITVSVIATCLSQNSCTSLSGPSGPITPFSVTDGTITVTTATVPEPATLLLSLLAVPTLAWRRKKSSI